MYKTKIIASIGPATDSEVMLKKMENAGMNIARLNFSHGTWETAKLVMDRVKKMNKTLTIPVHLMLDTKGPEIRTSVVKDAISVPAGSTVILAYEKTKLAPAVTKGKTLIAVDYKDIARDLQKGSVVQLDGGLLPLVVTKVGTGYVEAKAKDTGVITSKRHVNLPGTRVRLDALTEQDKKDITFCMKQGVDSIAMSFVRDADDITALRTFLKTFKGQKPLIIAKIETAQAVDNLEEIVAAADGIMVARGDLSVEVEYYKVPVIQKRIIHASLQGQKPVIMATQMLKSMQEFPMPTRAEMTDVANAAFEEVDAVMLSEESTVGKFPVLCVETLKEITYEVEKYNAEHFLPLLPAESTEEGLARAAVVLAEEIHAKGIVVLTDKEEHIRILAASRPKMPIFAFVPNAGLQARSVLYRGVYPLVMPKVAKGKDPMKEVGALLKKLGWVKKGERVVVIADMLVGGEKLDTIQTRTLVS